MLNITQIEPHSHTPSYLLTCVHTWHRTVIDPLNAGTVQKALGENKLDLILLTTATEGTLLGAETLHQRTGAPVLAAENLRETSLPVARYLEDGTIVGLGPLAQTVLIPDGNILCYALGSENIIFTGPLFATGLAEHKANKKAIMALSSLPDYTLACGGGAHFLKLHELLTAAHAS